MNKMYLPRADLVLVLVHVMQVRSLAVKPTQGLPHVLIQLYHNQSHTLGR